MKKSITINFTFNSNEKYTKEYVDAALEDIKEEIKAFLAGREITVKIK